MLLDLSTSSEESPAELVTPDTSKPLSSRALCMTVIDASGSCSTDTTEVTMFGETHLTCPGHEPCITSLMAETQVGQCRFPRRNEVMIGSAVSRPAVRDGAILMNIAAAYPSSAGGSDGVLDRTCGVRSATKNRYAQADGCKGGGPYLRHVSQCCRLDCLY